MPNRDPFNGEQVFRTVFAEPADACLLIVDGVIRDCNRATLALLNGPASRWSGGFPGTCRRRSSRMASRPTTRPTP